MGLYALRLSGPDLVQCKRCSKGLVLVSPCCHHFEDQCLHSKCHTPRSIIVTVDHVRNGNRGDSVRRRGYKCHYRRWPSLHRHDARDARNRHRWDPEVHSSDRRQNRSNRNSHSNRIYPSTFRPSLLSENSAPEGLLKPHFVLGFDRLHPRPHRCAGYD